MQYYDFMCALYDRLCSYRKYPNARYGSPKYEAAHFDKTVLNEQETKAFGCVDRALVLKGMLNDRCLFTLTIGDTEEGMFKAQIDNDNPYIMAQAEWLYNACLLRLEVKYGTKGVYHA